MLPYLVRRLLENGATTSFVNRILDESIPVEDIVADPVDISRASEFRPHGRIPDPPALYGDRRRNAKGYNLADRRELGSLLTELRERADEDHRAAPIVSGHRQGGEERQSVNPADLRQLIGTWESADPAAVDEALATAVAGQPSWNRAGAEQRADILERCADCYEANSTALLSLCIREAGKSLPDAIAELREAVDFLRYYAAEARRQFATPLELPGPTGERNQLQLRGRGVILCISPWNFPLAIFTGQIAAALAAGNAVLAKPAEQTTLVAGLAVRLMLESGVPADVLQFIPGDGADIGGYAASRPDVAGVAFTGSTETARKLQQTLARRRGPMPVFVAETGGLNALFVDSSALPEQVVIDAAYSAFNSAGQRCSALRILCVQKDVAPRILELLSGHMDELVVGDPAVFATDVGPVIDAQAKKMLDEYIEAADSRGSLIQRCRVPDACRHGTFVAPVAIEIKDLAEVDREIFGPVLHVYRYRARDLGATIDAINAKGYGLTMGLHSRIDGRARTFIDRSGAGNIYINRNLVGAVVGVQPFGGRGLSGTGPKAGGPHYLTRFATEVAISNNVAAVGGNATLLSLDDQPESS
ncbi:MAG: bifunctional proline dehydrogenase/L-glutamate gamma-semialdehyde dehydrogenase PutA [Woeseiaceae bacterium]|nr:bifunctional proline dehydrogenase/L-glutamate gamma-semialdehyde dehydrogenase PutA [Woeseiaceae bacterium]